MYKARLGVAIIVLLLSACESTEPPPAVYNGTVEQITGVDPSYEPYHPTANQDYTINGQHYTVIQDPQNFSQQGLASWYSENDKGKRTATGESFDPYELTAAHPTLPIPSYVRITNLNNGRRLVIRINDRGPFVKGRIIELSPAVVSRLNLAQQTPLKIDFIQVSPDGQLSGPGAVGTEVLKQSFALPERPVLPKNPETLPSSSGNNGLTTPTNGEYHEPSQPSGEYDEYRLPEENATPIQSEPPATDSERAVEHVQPTAGFMLQVAALSDAERADNWQKKLSNTYSVPGRVLQNGGIYRVQLGPFPSRLTAEQIQQRLYSEERQPSFITTDQ